MKQNKLFLIIMLVVFLQLIIIVLFSKLKIELYKKEKGQGILNLRIGFITIKKIDLGKSFLNMMESHLLSSNIKNAINNYKIVIDNNDLIKKYLKQMTIKKIVFIPRFNSESPIFMPYISVINWSIISSIKKLISDYFLKVKNEYYQIYYNDETKKGLDLEINLEVSIARILMVSIKNLKHLVIMIKRFKKEGKIYGNYESTSK